jgi:predicted RNA binding protein with dsRBD fold (UPF0201 family)
MVEVRVRARCYPTEDRDKVIRAIKAFFPESELSGEEDIRGVAHSVEALGDQLRRQQIRDAARSVLRRGLSGNTTAFRLNKQVASVGKISFSDEDRPLGDIEVEIVAEDIESVIDKIAPHTSLGATG